MAEFRAILMHPNQIDVQIKTLPSTEECNIWFRSKMKDIHNQSQENFPYGYDFLIFDIENEKLIFADL